jgi:DNA-binding NarL/FixJ family response regulator
MLNRLHGPLEAPVKAIGVALADDHPIVLAGITALIATVPEFHLLGTATDADGAVALIACTKPDVAVLDVTMPGNEDRTLVGRCRDSHPALKILILTTHEDRHLAALQLHDGAMGYLLKRSAVLELARAIRIVAEGGIYIDPAVAATLKGGGTGPDPARTVTLSQREEAVLRMVAQGLSGKEAAHRLSLSAKTIETYRARASEKIGAHSRADIVRYGIRQGWLTEA